MVNTLCLCSDLPNLHLGTPFDLRSSRAIPKVKCRIISNPGASEEDNCLTQRCYEKTAANGVLQSHITLNLNLCSPAWAISTTLI